ncbi:hypothetical protein BGP77_05425 [Saccharospirillum sp. MSK14-1]|uniref:SixA phosphatase family protein n=1 Tax=Saccharospirillum sp. MSK14-1 TaxID=1897632 RepID=UPI000D36B3CB|nr:histidine phosphatase family protein [Saccharospirillum sp. MSK14-1]PTY36730.1 hypothetical protein BGP77_05425 [Saccharospirillum sp. MSK14-1]
MRLMLLRHGQAQASAPRDEQRRLVPAGEVAILRQRQWLDPSVSAFYCSPYQRARESAELIRPTLGDRAPIIDDRLTPDQSIDGALDLLRSAEGESILLVAHNPLLSHLAGVLSGDPYGVSLPTAGLVCLEADGWFPGSAQLLWQK